MLRSCRAASHPWRASGPPDSGIPPRSGRREVKRTNSTPVPKARMKEARAAGTRSSGGAEEEAEDLSAPSAAYAAEPRPFKCSVCEKTYKDPATLRQHEKTHWLTRPFPCNICGKMFTQRGTMTRHMRSHLGLKPFACDECGMRFTRQYRLTEHMRVHSGEKPYECQLCGGKFTQQRNLISHLRMHTSPS